MTGHGWLGEGSGTKASFDAECVINPAAARVFRHPPLAAGGGAINAPSR